MGGHWGTFLSDLKLALRVWKRFPPLPLITIASTLVPALTPISPYLFLPLIFVGIYWLGWVGTERIMYLRGFRGLTITPGEAWHFTRSFLGRYFVLGLIFFVPYLVLLIPIALIFGGSVGDPEGIWGAIISVGLATLALDIALTFVTPALAFTTGEPTDAVKIGWRMLREGWPGTAWYAVLPPMAFVAITYSRPSDAANQWAWVLASCVAALLNLLAKGAVAAFYLREHPEVGNDGAAFDDQRVPTPPRLGGPLR